MLSKKFKLILSFTVLVILVFAGSWYFYLRKDSTMLPKQYVVKIGYTPTTNSLSIFTAREKGIFSINNIETILIEFPGGSQMNDALVRGDIDASCCSGIQNNINSEITSPNQVKLYAVSDERKNVPWNALIVKSGSGIKALNDLEGKTIGHLPGSAFLYLKKFLTSKNIDISKITFKSTEVKDQLLGLENQNLAAVFAYEPTISISKTKGNFEILYSQIITDMDPNAITGAGAISTKFTTQNPELARKFVSSMDEANIFIRENPKEAIKYQFKYDQNLTTEIADKIAILDYYPNSEIPVDKLQEYLDFLFEIGVIKQKVKAEDLIYRP